MERLVRLTNHQPTTNMDITGKTIAKVIEMKKPGYDDTGWLKLEFTDGTHCVIWAGYGGYTGESEDEYPTCIGISDDADGLVPSEDNAERIHGGVRETKPE